MNTTEKPRSVGTTLQTHKPLVAVGAILLLCLVLFIFRGWIRMTVLPKTVGVVHANAVQKVYEDEMDKLHGPIALLGYQQGEMALKGCNTVVANGLKTEVNCSYYARSFQKITPSAEGKKTLNANAEKLQKLLQTNGWEGQYSNDGPYTSLVKLVSSITSGIDYQPDAAYQKRIGNVQCLFDNNTAFSKPDVPAMATQISCSRVYDILGKPSWN